MPLEVFYSYSHEDEKLRDKLEKQLSLLQRNGLIVSWHDRRIGAGQEWRDQIDAHVCSAHIILLLISADFIASDYCYGVEMQIALERQGKHEAVVIPVILRPADWSTAPFARLQALPRNGKPVTRWDDEDEAFADVARGIRELVARFQPSAPNTSAGSVPLVDKFVPKPRVVDAAIPSHIVKKLGTRLLVLIRLPDSRGLRGILHSEEDTEARPADVRSRPFEVTFPLGVTGKADPLKVTVKITSPDFSPSEQAKNVFVPPEADSEVCPFMLTPKRIGRLTVLVELQWEDAVRGHRSLLTECVAEATDVPAQPKMNLVQMHMSVSRGSAGRLAGALKPSAPAIGGTVRSPMPGAASSDESDDYDTLLAEHALERGRERLDRAERRIREESLATPSSTRTTKLRWLKTPVHSYPMPSSRLCMISRGCRQNCFSNHDIICKVSLEAINVPMSVNGTRWSKERQHDLWILFQPFPEANTEWRSDTGRA